MQKMAKSREVIQLHIGQAGNQIAHSCWQLYCLEHGIYPDGTLYHVDAPGEDFNAFFSVNQSCKVHPRVLFIDLEPSVIDEIRLGTYRQLFPTSTMVTGKEDASSNYARGYHSLGSDFIDYTMEKVKSMVEHCESLQGFMIFRALGGGTGSGFGNLIIDQLQQEYKKVPRVEVDVFPSPKVSPLIVEPYNAALAVHAAMDTIDCSIVVDNEALYDICSQRLTLNNVDYFNLNRIIAQAVSCITSSLRFSGDLNVDIAEFQTNLVPFKRVHFPVVSYAPLQPRKSGVDQQTTTQLTSQVFDTKHQLVKCDLTGGKYMSCGLFYRGDVCGIEINRAVREMKQKRQEMFVDWSPTSFKIGINSQPPMCVPGGDLAHSNKAVCMLSNNTAIVSIWEQLLEKFDLLMSKRGFVYHYIEEGLEEGEFGEVKEDITSLIEDYKAFDPEVTTPDTKPKPSSRR